MSTEYNKMLASGVVPSMEDVVVATTTTIGKMGIGPNECDALNKNLDQKVNLFTPWPPTWLPKGRQTRHIPCLKRV